MRKPDASLSERAFLMFLLFAFIAAAGTTLVCSRSMAAMDEMPMPGGWTMSMMWMRMTEQNWLCSAGEFLSMWLVMMIAMMLPSVASPLSHYRQALRRQGDASLNRMTALVGAGYILVWALIGIAVLPLGAALAFTQMQHPSLARLAPIAVAGIVMVGGAVQFTNWKVQRLRCCAGAFALGYRLPGNTITAFQQGVRLGLHCCYCCANLTAIILVIGVMDLRVMGVATFVMSIERVALVGRLAARVSGALLIGAGLILSARAVALSP